MGKVITIDGPSASGKTSVSREVAKKLNCQWFSTGAIYRGLAFVIKEKKISEFNESLILPLCRSDEWCIKLTPEATEVYYNGSNVTVDIHHEDIGTLASKISILPNVRAALIQGQRKFQELNSLLVVEGRDCGTVIFPKAELKFFLTADLNRRVERRVLEVNARDPSASVDLKSASKKQAERDRRDAERKTAPMMAASDAVLIDATELTLEEVSSQIFRKALDLGLV